MLLTKFPIKYSSFDRKEVCTVNRQEHACTLTLHIKHA